MSFRTDNDRWQAVAARDKNADGKFVYAVKTTGVYCRPVCAARLANRQNVQFYATPAESERAGFRACKRCKPNKLPENADHAAAITHACRLIGAAKGSLALQVLAKSVGLSPSHFHRIFKSFTGLTPKQYAIGHQSQRVRKELQQRSTVTLAIFNAGFNSSGRFYANSTKVLGMKPADFKLGGEGAKIRFAIGNCSLGSILVAASDLGICAITLGDEPALLTKDLNDRFPKAQIVEGQGKFEQMVHQVIAFVEHPLKGLELPLHVQGSAFQQRVWKKLCEIPTGQTRSYFEIAKAIGQPTATRAVAGACGANSIAVAIPCHRVVRSDGSLSGYRWGVQRKARLLNSERMPDQC